MSCWGCVIPKVNESSILASHTRPPFGSVNVVVLGVKLQPAKPRQSCFNCVSRPAPLFELLFVQTLTSVVAICATAEQVALGVRVVCGPDCVDVGGGGGGGGGEVVVEAFDDVAEDELCAALREAWAAEDALLTDARDD